MNNTSLSKALSWKELALLYAPRLKPKSAVRRLKLWVLKHEILHADAEDARLGTELRRAGRFAAQPRTGKKRRRRAYSERSARLGFYRAGGRLCDHSAEIGGRDR